MYKVFIDQKPVVFIEKEELSTENIVDKAKNISNLDELKPLLKKASIDSPVYLTAKNPKKAFKAFFSEYKKINAAGGIVQRKSKFLVIKRKGKWDIPKGRIDKGEEAEAACVREIMEECGIEGHSIVHPLCETYHCMKWNGRPALKRTYWYMLSYDGPKETKPEVKEDITVAKWMTREKLLGIRKKTFGSINVVLDAFVENYPE
ncbi:MAG: NUDIX domain-containing protein [bacterium]|nr:NUDIX domain-containing protein [bacterium]